VKRAPALDCCACGRRIGLRAGHYLLEDRRLVCGRCLTRPVHARLFADCPHRWHDPLDHLDSTGTRAGIAHALGLWP
jgi:hypothetical protein